MNAQVLLYPPWLNADSKGAAVEDLQRRLNEWAETLGISSVPPGNIIFPLEVNGEYTSVVKVAVAMIQAGIGFEGEDIDGNLGQGTRARVKARLGVDINDIPGSPEEKTYWFGPNHKAGEPPSVWPE